MGVTFAIVAEFTSKFTEFEGTPFCQTCATPDIETAETVATIWVLLQLTIAPGLVPNVSDPAPCVFPKPVPVTVTCVPGAPLGGETFVIVGDQAETLNTVDALNPPKVPEIVVVPAAS